MDETERPVLVCLHFLGGSAAVWHSLEPWIAHRYEVLAVDLPGFGSAAALGAADVAAMADHVVAAVRARAPVRWELAGHSMGGKVAMVVARRAQDGEPGLAGLQRVVTLGGSPPAPEPMQDTQRRTMLGWFAGDTRDSREQAEVYVKQNVGSPLAAAAQAALVDGVLQSDRGAWSAWLEHGSREDWVERIGTLLVPGLLIAGSEDSALGEATMRRLIAPHFQHAEIHVLHGAGHLSPVERPEQVASLLLGSPAVDPGYRALIASDRVSSRTRSVLLAREADERGTTPTALTQPQMSTLRAVVDCVVPQQGPVRIDLAARLQARLASGAGDGWRFDALPPDELAWPLALDAMEGFAGLPHAAQEAWLQRLAGKAGGGGALSGEQMALWFEDLRAEAARLYAAHPATLARMGYSGIGYGGDGPDKPGFVQIGAGQREAWEPMAR